MPDFLARETGKTTTPGRAFAGYVQDPPPGVHGHLADSYGRAVQVGHAGRVVTVTFAGAVREFAPRERGEFMRALMAAEWDAEAVPDDQG